MEHDFTDEEKRLFLQATAERTDLGLWDQSEANVAGSRQTFVLIWILENEVCNGGFYQYAYNSSGEGVPYVAGALKAIGADYTLSLLQRALDIIGPVPWDDETQRQGAIEALDEKARDQLDELDQLFYANTDDISALLFNYVVSHLKDFPPPASA